MSAPGLQQTRSKILESPDSLYKDTVMTFENPLDRIKKTQLYLFEGLNEKPHLG